MSISQPHGAGLQTALVGLARLIEIVENLLLFEIEDRANEEENRTQQQDVSCHVVHDRLSAEHHPRHEMA
jgi:hypothetical protein